MIYKLAKDISNMCAIKLASTRRQLNRLKEKLLSPDGVAYHGTGDAGIQGVIAKGKIDTPLRMVKDNPGIMFEHPLYNYARTTAGPAFIDNVNKYVSLPPHLRGEARKGYFNYLDNKESALIRELRSIFGDDLPEIVNNPLVFEAAAGKPGNYLKKKMFKDIIRKYTDGESLSSLDPSYRKKLLGFIGDVSNRERNSVVPLTSSRNGKTPPDMVSFADDVHLGTRFGNNGVLTSKKGIPIVNGGLMEYGNNIVELEHAGPYRLRRNDIIISPKNGIPELAGTGLRSVHPDVVKLFKKLYPNRGQKNV